ncbi:MAG: NAD-dependent epimerase/dehydratase family protein [Nitrospiraceae bacterium]|nr:MAG: NAD-dependent epimerase/dehydratase family protein [Nitrospiraceae bacterium]
MKALITGGAGFIGSHLAEALLEEGHEVYIIDDLSTGSIDNIDHLKERKGFHYVVDTIMNSPLLAELVDKCDIVYHLAAAVGVMLIVESPVRTIETNVKGTEEVLKHANKKKKKVIIASTSEVYGKSSQKLFREDGDLVMGSTTKGRWSYACSKALDEFLGLAYWKEKGLPVVVLRFFNIVGPRQTGRYGMVIPRFVKQALHNKPITVFGDGKQSRCFAHVKDAVDALIKIGVTEDAVGQVINLGNDSEVSIEELAIKVMKLANSKSEIQYISYDDAYEEGFEDMLRRVPDLSKINKLIGYKSKYDLDDIIKDVIKYYREH